MLAGVTDATGGSLPDGGTLLEMAKECLADLSFFGLRERFDESARLLAHTFGWEPFEDVPVRNGTGVMNHRLRLTAADLEAAQEITVLDAALFRFARRLFLGRLTSLKPARKTVEVETLG
jgi:hypothetical protein